MLIERDAAVGARRLRQTRSWVVSLSILGRFEAFRGPEALSRGRVDSRAEPRRRRQRHAIDASTRRQRRHRLKFKVNFNTLTKHATLFFDVM